MPIYVNYNMKLKDPKPGKFKFTNEKGVPYSQHSKQIKVGVDYPLGNTVTASNIAAQTVKQKQDHLIGQKHQSFK